MEFRHTCVVKTVGLRNAQQTGHQNAGARSAAASGTAGEGHTREAVIKLLLEEGPITATAIGERLGLSPAGVRRHLDALIESGEARATRSAPWQQKGRGRPAKQFQLTATGRGKLGHAYDDLAGAAMRQIRELGGDAAITDFARKRVQAIVAGVGELTGHTPAETEAKAEEIAEAFSDAGFAASTRKVGAGVQICQHHCPVSHVAEEFPELCAAELEAFREILGTHVQRLATIANGDCACTTHVPLVAVPTHGSAVGPTHGSAAAKSNIAQQKSAQPLVAQPATTSTHDSGRSAE
ncbi:helix-turn-helix transcriptional regulator [Nocardia concava]|uniref:helix-turn-helix transcriptional regulator n=1 Tax=Nocardia concava TaxID=257281 RepID=UPI0006854A9C|nr:metalloregulator ArsR/SmtB family transcription factor [Nocardia concava]